MVDIENKNKLIMPIIYEKKDKRIFYRVFMFTVLMNKK